MFTSESNAAFRAALLLHNFTSIECIYDPDADQGQEVYILSKSHSNQLYKLSNDLMTIEKWLCIEHEITSLTKAGQGNLLLQDEYGDFHIIRPDFSARA